MHYKLLRVALQNWYLVQAQDISFLDATSFIGPTGAGKTTLVDALQYVMCGGNHRKLSLNSGANEESTREVIEYCLGYVKPSEDGGKPLRPECETVIALVFGAEKPDGTVHHVTIGVAMSAREDEPRETILARFIIPGYAYSANTFRRKDGEGEYLMSWVEIEKSIKSEVKNFATYREGSRFVADFLAVMRPNAHQPDPDRFIKSFSRAVHFKVLGDVTHFVREFILERDTLNVKGVRETVAVWNEVTAKVREVEERQKKIIDIRRKFDEWATNIVRSHNLIWDKACADVEIARINLRKTAKEASTAIEEYERRKRAQQTQEDILKSEREELEDARALLSTSDQATRLRLNANELDEANRQQAEIEKQINDVRSVLNLATNLSGVIDFVPNSFHPIIASAQAGLTLIGTKPGVGWITDRAESVAPHLKSLAQLGDLSERLRPQMENIDDKLSGLRRERDNISDNIKRLRAGGSQLSEHTTEYIKLLEAQGIKSTPLCDVVEVVDKSWQKAVESMLGLVREALIVDPAEVFRANEILYQNRNARGLHKCRLVKSTRTAYSEKQVHENSIANVLQTDNPHAWAAIVANIGSCRMANSEEELDRALRAVMKNGKATSGMTYNVTRDPTFILGRESKIGVAEALHARLGVVTGDIEKLNRTRKDLEQAGIIASGASQFSADLDGLKFRYEENQRKLVSVIAAKKAILADVDPELQERIESLENSTQSRQNEIDEYKPQLETIAKKAHIMEANARTKRDEMKYAVRSKMEAITGFRDGDLRALAENVRDLIDPIFLSIRNPYLGRRLEADYGTTAWVDRLKAVLTNHKDEVKACRQSADRYERQARDALMQYFADQNREPIITGDHHSRFDHLWVKAEEMRLALNELVQYKDEAEAAKRDMISAIKEDLLTKLKSKFDKMAAHLRTLNLHMRRHKFIGQTYVFYRKPKPEYDRIRRLAIAVSSQPEMAQSIIERTVDDPHLIEAMNELETFLAQSGGEGLEDYRNYYDYQMYMWKPNAGEDDDGSVELDENLVRKRDMTSLTGKVGKGSGGEGQTPFYVVIAVSMAMSYFPGGRPGKDQSGLGLVLFDEAFSRPDIPTTQAIITFYKDLGLQLVVAAPEDKRPTFTEVMDTIINVYKDDDARKVYIQSDHPKERARQELSKINPDHIGVEGFRKMLAQGEAANLDAAQ
jgi:uncharacterized protein YPO0396